MITRQSTRRRAAGILIPAVAVALAAPAASAHDDDAPTLPATAVAKLRAATAAFHDAQRAIAAGYLPSDACEPGMGQHWVNPAHLADGVHDITRPDILLYEPTRTGHRLVGAEWIQIDADQDLATDDDRPSLAGMPFDGPMLGHEPGMPVHYDLHVYAWSPGPGSLTSTHNPRVEC